MESFIYIILYFFKMKLPWMDIKTKNHSEKKAKIIEIHQKINAKNMFEGIPYQFYFIYKDIKELKLMEMPNYELYLKILKELILINKFDENMDFCWEKKILEYVKNYYSFI